MTDRSSCFDVPKHHRTLWREFVDETPAAEQACDAGDQRVAGFSDGFAPELFHRLYSDQPREIPVEQRSRAAAVRSRLHALVDEVPEFDVLCKQAARDPLWAGMAASTLAEHVAGSLPSHKQPPADVDRARTILDGLRTLAEQTPELARALEEDMARCEGALAGAERACLDQAEGVSETGVRQAVRAGVEAAQEAIDQAEAALTAFGWGEGAGTGKTARDPGASVELARRVRSSAQLKKIVELAGRLTMTARAKRAARTEYARSEIVGVEPTSNLSRLLPSELSNLASPLGTALLYKKLLERAALGYRLAGSEKQARGPIVILIDQSGSMEGVKDAWAKAVALALLDAARAERRAFGVILYDACVRQAKLYEHPEQADPRELLDLLSFVPDGGTAYEPAVTKGLDWISVQKNFRNADLVHLTDGEASLDGCEQARERARTLGANVYGIAIGCEGRALKAWSDQVTSITDVTADGPAVDLIFDHV